MHPDRYTAADHAGTFCIAWTTTSSVDPEIVTNLWPTKLMTYDVIRYYFDHLETADRAEEHWPKLLAGLTVVRTMPGEYFVGIKDQPASCWRIGRHIALADGGRTLPISVTVQVAQPPKVRKGVTIYWESGMWTKRLKSGRVRINPLEV